MLGTLIAGVGIGVVLVLSILYNVYQHAQKGVLLEQVKVLNKEQVAADEKLGKLAATVQQQQNLPYVINLSDQFVSMLSERVCNTVQVILNSQNEAALKKLN